MLQRVRFCLLPAALCGLVCIHPPRTYSQTTATDANGQTVLKVTARTVVLDVVVTGRNGQPVQGLHKEDFLVSEDGHPQIPTYFEEHTGQQPVSGNQANLPPELAADTFSNLSRVPQTDSVTVLLLDSLNTPIKDQAFVHAQILKFMKNLQPGRRMAIFTLGTELRFLQGFTDDPVALSAALNKKTATPRSSPLLQSNEDAAANQQAVAMMADHAAAASQALQKFLAEQAASQNDQRVKMTLLAFQEIANYLAGFPGRKNLVWFSSAFPLVLLPQPGDAKGSQRDYGEEVQRTDNLLSAAQVAIYPIAAEGLATSSLFDADQQLTGVTNGQQAQQHLDANRQEESDSRNNNYASMGEIAAETGGEAIRDTNGLNDALARVVDHGSNFYTLTYTPTNTARDGQVRRIKVRISRSDLGALNLAYRRGYYADDAKALQASMKPGDDPLRAFMNFGMPASTQIPLMLRVQRTASTDGTVAGDSSALDGTLTRYSVNFMLKTKDVQFTATPDGGQHGKVEATLLVYNPEGKPLNWTVRQIALDMNAARFAAVQASGIHFRLDIDAPKEATVIRSGVFDLNGNQAGTLEVPLSSVVMTEPVAEVAPPAASSSVSTNDAAAPPKGLVPPNGLPAAKAPEPPATPVVASSTAAITAPKKTPVSFWSLPSERVDDWLLHTPSDDRERFDRLREEFAGLHCSSYLMKEQPSGRKDGKNLVCSLPGKDTSQIVVIARYDRRAGVGANRWSEALMLPLLYNALRAQSRQHTFVFAALDGEAGEKTFFDDLLKRTGQLPGSLVVLDSLGLGVPSIYTSDEGGGSKKGREIAAVRKLLESDALVSASILRLPNPIPILPDGIKTGSFAFSQTIDNLILDRERDLPAILIQSTAMTTSSKPVGTNAGFRVAARMTPEAFHQDFNFAAYFLCRIDADLSFPAL